MKHTAAVATIAVLLPAAAIALAICALPVPPLVDMPNHLARAYVINELDASPQLAAFYRYDFSFCPYILGDLVLVGLLNIFSPIVAARILAVFLFLSFPAALLFYLHARRTNIVLSAPVFLALLLYLSLNYFFLAGYNSYCLSVSLCFLGLGMWERWRRTSGRQAAMWYAGFVSAVVVTYLAHLAGFFFFGLFLAALVLSQLRITVRGVLSGLPFLLLIAWHVQLEALGGSGDDAIFYLGLVDKIRGLGAANIRYHVPADAFLFALFLLACATAALRRRMPPPNDGEQAEMFILIAVSLLAFAALPYGIGFGLQTDLRAIQFTTVFILCLAFSRLGGEPLPRWMTAGAAAFGLVNAAVVIMPWLASKAFLLPYQQALESLPAGKKILAVYTRPSVGRFDPGIHHSDLYAVVGGGFSPDIYSNSNSPRQFPYFSFRTAGYTPGEFWYVRGEDAAVDWERIDRTYDYLVVTKPFDRSRIRLADVDTAFENDAVAVLALNAAASADEQP